MEHLCIFHVEGRKAQLHSLQVVHNKKKKKLSSNSLQTCQHFKLNGCPLCSGVSPPRPTRGSEEQAPSGVWGRAPADHVLAHSELVTVHLRTRKCANIDYSVIHKNRDFTNLCAGWREYAQKVGEFRQKREGWHVWD